MKPINVKFRKLELFYIILTFFLPIIALFSSKALTLLLVIYSLPFIFYSFKEKKNLKTLFSIKDFNLLKLSISLFFLWMLIAVSWSPDIVKGFKLWFRILLLFVIFFIAFKQINKGKSIILPNDKLLKILTISIIICLIFYFTERFFGQNILNLIKGPNYRLDYIYSSGICFIAMISWLSIDWAYKNYGKFKAFFLWLFIFTGIILTISEAAKITFFTSSIIYLLHIISPRLSFRLTSFAGSFCIIIFLLAPNFLNIQKLSNDFPIPPSQIARLCMWQYIGKLVLDKPIIGYGFNSSRYLTDEEEGCVIPVDEAKYNDDLTSNFGIYMHPHNIFLQSLLEMGIIGFSLFFLLFLSVIFNVSKIKNLNLQRIYLVVFLSYIFIGLIGYGIWQNWFISALLLALLKTHNLLISKSS
ncbi:MAG: O-antigen ligase family protein [Rickettsiales bacterium]|nr:O-antigen ligase family protein [Rickettsiales bacterium]